MTRMKKITAFLLALVTMVTVSGCSFSDTSWSARYGDKTVSAGVYIYYIVQAYQDAFYQVEDMTQDVLKQTVEDQDAAVWIATQAQNGLLDFMATEQEFDRLGLSLDEDTQATVDSLTEQMWAYSGEIYQRAGISKESYREVVANAYKQNEIFTAYYDEGGEFEVSQQELQDYFASDYAKLKYLYINYEDPAEETEEETTEETAETSEEETAEDTEESTLPTKEEALATANEYLEKINQGATMDEVIDEYNTSQGQTVDTTDASRNVNYLQNTADNQELPLIVKAFSMEFDKPEVFSTDGRVYLIARYDPLADPADLETNREGLLQNLKFDEFEEKVDALADSLTYTMNDAAVKRYSVKTIVGKVS